MTYQFEFRPFFRLKLNTPWDRAPPHNYTEESVQLDKWTQIISPSSSQDKPGHGSTAAGIKSQAGRRKN